MSAISTMPDEPLIDAQGNRSIAVKRSKSNTFCSDTSRNSNTKNGQPSVQTFGIGSPPATPQRTKKRVKFSEPGLSSSTGLTPFLQRSSFSSPPPTRSRRHSTPSRRWNLAMDDSAASGTLQFVPLRQVLDGRVKRRLRRNRLSEEFNAIQQDRKNEKKDKVENDRLKDELRQKDQEIQHLREELDLAGQSGGEAGASPVNTSHIEEKIRDLEGQLTRLRAELQRREMDEATNDDPNLTVVARDLFDDDDTFMPNYDDDFNAEMTDMFLSTPNRGSFPSPPETMPNTPSKPNSAIGTDGERSSPDLEKKHLESQLGVLRGELEELLKTLELTNTSHERLTAKLSGFLSPTTSCEKTEFLDAALDTVLTQLALSQSLAVESSARFSALTGELAALFPSPSSSQDPEPILQLLNKQFRAARLELEYLAPGENPEGFNNTKLLDMLVSRLRVLTKKVSQQDADIDQYHSQEISLRKQLGSRVDAIDVLQNSLNTAKSDLSAMNLDLSAKESDLRERDESISKLNHALQGYRDEVKGLEMLINRLEVEHAADLAKLREQIETTETDAQGKLLDSELKLETLQAMADGREMLMVELEQRLSAALTSAQALKDEVTLMDQEKTSSIKMLQESAIEREKKHGDALALRDTRVAELREEVERVNASLKEAHQYIVDLKREKRDLASQLEGEKVRSKIVIEAMTAQAARLQETGLGYSAGHVAVRGSSEAGISEGNSSPAISSPVTPQSVVTFGRYFDGGLARKQSGQAGKKRRRYDSGLGFLDEQDEEILESMA